VVSHISRKTSEMWGTRISLWGRTYMTEPWLQGTLTDLPVLQRAVLHSLQMAQEDTAKWCGGLDDREIHARPFALPSVAFQLRHIARSLDRFCTYAEGTPLSREQLTALANEMENNGTRDAIFSELEASLENTRRRLEVVFRQPLDTPIAIGRQRLPTTLAGLLVHAAEHTQRHVGQAITTAKVILAQRP
jgi:uncharacterized damage-inducible protein DinB